MLSNAYFLAKIRFYTAENEPANFLQNSAKIATFATLLGGKVDPRRRAARREVRGERARVRAGRADNALQHSDGRRQGRRHDDRSAKFRQNVARFRLYRHRFLQENTRFEA